jgi:hypothetical protein
VFIGAGVFQAMLLNFRTLSVEGRYGGGKTLLVVALADWMLRAAHVSICHANFATSLASPVEIPLHDAVLLMDEAHNWIPQGVDNEKVREYLAYLRKTNCYFFASSVFDVSKMVGRFSVERQLDFRVIGLPLWWYKWTLHRRGKKEQGSFFIWQPSSVYGLYDHWDKPKTDGGFLDAARKSA